MSSGIPWFMFDLSNFVLFTTDRIPSSDITDKKKINIIEVPVPGLGHEPKSRGGFGNNHIGFTIPIIRRNELFGNTNQIKFFEQLRNPVTPLLSPFASTEFVRGPSVLYQWGTAKIPLIYDVHDVSFVHKSKQVNGLGFTKWTEVTFDLSVDEENFLFQGEKLFTKVGAIIGSVESLVDALGAGKTF